MDRIIVFKAKRERILLFSKQRKIGLLYFQSEEALGYCIFIAKRARIIVFLEDRGVGYLFICI